MSEKDGTAAAPDPESVAEIYGAALELEPAERGAFLARACADRPRVRAEVESLLHAHRHATSFLARSPVPALLAAEAPPIEGSRIGAYRLISEIGRGGMGTVYLAERADGGFEQQVALKLIRHGIGSAAMRDRFLRERQILARLEHANIARLLDGGVTEDGWPYFALELVRGTPLTDYSDRRRLPIAARLALFDQACQAVRHAHAHLVVHRDLKPSNMLVGEDGVLKLLDFGIAKVLTEEPENGAALTRAGFHPLTPEYAAPEQLRGEAATTATDVYVLGIVLFELLTGRRPARSRAGEEEGEPDSPVTVVTRPIAAHAAAAASRTPAEIAALRGTTPGRLRRELAGDLEAIVLQALQPSAARRYPSVEALAEDLARFRAGLPVRARPATFRYRWGKLLRRHRVAFCAAAAALASLLAGLAVSLWQARVAERERDRAAAAAAEAGEVAAYLVDLFRDIDPEVGAGDGVTARELLDRGAARLDGGLSDRPLTRARLQEAIAGVYHHLHAFPSAEKLLLDAVAAREREQGPSHPDLLAPLLDLGAIQYRTYQFGPARVTLERAIRIAEAGPIERPAEMRRGLTLLGNLHLGVRSWAAAEREFRRALEVLERTDPAGAVDRTGVFNNLGVALFFQGRLDEAEELQRRALELRERAHGPTHFSVAQSLVNLTMIANARHDTEKAAPWIERALAIREATYGHEHPNVAEALSLRAECAHGRGDLRAAESDWREALRIREAVIGAGNPQTEWTRMKLAILLLAEGKLDEAVPVAEAALTSLRAAEGVDPLDLLRARAAVAELRWRRGDLDGARAVMQVDESATQTRADARDVAAVAEAFAVRLAENGLDEEAARIRTANRELPGR